MIIRILQIPYDQTDKKLSEKKIWLIYVLYLIRVYGLSKCSPVIEVNSLKTGTIGWWLISVLSPSSLDLYEYG